MYSIIAFVGTHSELLELFHDGRHSTKSSSNFRIDLSSQGLQKFVETARSYDHLFIPSVTRFRRVFAGESILRPMVPWPFSLTPPHSRYSTVSVSTPTLTKPSNIAADDPLKCAALMFDNQSGEFIADRSDDGTGAEFTRSIGLWMRHDALRKGPRS